MIKLSPYGEKVRADLVAVTSLQEQQVKALLVSSGFRTWGNPFYTGQLECLPNLVANLTRKGFGYDLEEVKPLLVAAIESCEARYASTLKQIEEIEKASGMTLWPYQFRAVLKMAEAKSILCASEPGLGKTGMTLATIPPGMATLIVGPAIAYSTWKDQGRKWKGITVEHLRGSAKFRIPLPGETLYISFDSLPHLKSESKEGTDLDAFYKHIKHPVFLVADEIHYAKSWSASRTKRLRALCGAILKRGGRAIGLTGTPICNRPTELWCLFQNLNIAKDVFGSWDRFCYLFSGSKGQWGGYVWGQAKAESVDVIAKVVIRDTMEEVFPDMPAKIKEEFPLDIEDELLKADLDEIWKEVADLPPDEVLKRLQDISFSNISKMRERLANIKTEAALELVKEWEEYGEPIIVASCYKKPVEKIGKRKGWRLITGDTSGKDREEIQELLASGKLKGVALTTRAAGISLNLQSASRMIKIDLDPTPAANEQLEGRIYRIGQTKPCYYTTLIVEHPWERRVVEILDQKQAMADSTIGEIKNSPKRAIRQSEVYRTLLQD